MLLGATYFLICGLAGDVRNLGDTMSRGDTDADAVAWLPSPGVLDDGEP